MSKQSRIRILFSILGLGILGGAVYLTIFLISPPNSLSINAPATAFSAKRAMQDLEVIAQEPHPMGEFPARAAVRDFLLEEIRILGLEPQVQDSFGVRLVHSGFLVGGAVENILVRLPGTNADGAIILIAHYDSTPGGPGAGDNGAGVVTLLEILRKLSADSPLRQDVIFFFPDGHEPGIIGSHAFVAQHPWLEDIKLVINLDTILGSPVIAQTNQGNGLWIQAMARSVEKPTYLSLPLHLFPSGDCDLIPFSQEGLPGISFGKSVGTQEFHTALDLPEIISRESLQQAGNHILALIRYLGDQPNLEIEVPEQTFFPVLGWLVHYPTSWAMPIAALAGLCLIATVLYGFKIRRLTWKGTSLGFLTLLGFLILSLGISYLLWQGIQALHPEYEYSPVRPHLSDDYLYAIGFSVLVFAIATLLIAMARKKISALDLASGALVIWLPITIVVTILVPATSYLATLVLLVGSLVLLLALVFQSRSPNWDLSGLGFLVSGILATFLWVPVVYFAFAGLGFTMHWLIVGVVALWIGAMIPILDWITSPTRWLVPVMALLAGTGLLLGGHILVGKHSPPPLVNSIGYWLDAETDQASWIAFIGGYRTDARTSTEIQVAFPDEMDERQSQLLLNPVRRDYTELFPKAPGFSLLTSEAPILAQDGPGFEVISDVWDNGQRVVEIKFTTSMHDRLYIVLSEASLTAITLPNNERTELPGDTDWWLRFDGMPAEGIEIRFEFLSLSPIQFLLVEEKTGLPSFLGLVTQPEPGTMRSPGEFLQGDATDFAAIYRSFELPAFGKE